MGESLGSGDNVAEGAQVFPPSIKRTLIGRTVFQYEAGLLGDLTEQLTNDDYIKGLCSEQKRLLRSVNILFWVSLALAWVLLTKSLNLNAITITAFGISVPAGLVTKQVLFFSMAVLYGQGIMRMISTLLIAQVLQRAAEARFGTLWKIYLAKYEADTFWLDTLLLRNNGYASPRSHLVLILLAIPLLFSVSFGQLVAVNVAGYFTLTGIWNETTNYLDRGIAIFSATLIVSSSLVALFVSFVKLEFRWK